MRRYEQEASQEIYRTQDLSSEEGIIQRSDDAPEVSAPYSDENNDVLYKLRKRYSDAAENWKGTLSGFVLSLNYKDEADASDAKTVSFVIDMIVKKMMSESVNPDGSLSEGFSAYGKMEKRLKEYCMHMGIDYNALTLDDMTPAFVDRFLNYIVKKGTGRCLYVSQTLHAVLNKASKHGWFDIKSVQNCSWAKKIGKSAKKYETLTNEQCNRFVNLTIDELPKCRLSKLYHDFCVFILYTCQSTCDALSLRYSDIQTINGHDYFVFKRRKIASKQSTDCLVPINNVMREIMDRYKDKSVDGYIFPVKSNKRSSQNKLNNGEIKHFVSRINVWLKKLTPVIGCHFNLHTYVFRHTGITHYISKGVSHVYVANLAGTSVRNIEAIYYNNQADVTNRNLVLNAIGF